jgi:DNA-binding MarR family transcriptional regulator
MDGHIPLSAKLSQVLVAFIIEFDNEFERRMPHRTSRHGSTPGLQNPPWLVSMAMWTNFMQFVPDKGIAAGELPKLLAMNKANLRQWLVRLSRWGYLYVTPAAVIQPTVAGSKAQAIWRPLSALIEKRWEQRFGRDIISRLREDLRPIVDKLEAGLPDSLPILGYGLYSAVSRSGDRASADLALPALLSKVLLAFAVEFECDSDVSIAISANVLRLVSEEGVPGKDLPRLAGVSKEAIATSISFLEKRGYASVESGPAGSRVKILRLNAKGRHARQVYFDLPKAIEDRWGERFGKGAVNRLRESVEALANERLLEGIEPYPENWRASVPRAEFLPHYPMILHRGGFPDGS